MCCTLAIASLKSSTVTETLKHIEYVRHRNIFQQINNGWNAILRKTTTHVSFMYQKNKRLNFRGPHTPLQPFNSLPPEAERRRNVTKMTSGAPLVSFSVLRRRGKKASNKKEVQWRHWIANYQIRIRSCANLGRLLSAQQNYTILTVSARQFCRPFL